MPYGRYTLLTIDAAQKISWHLRFEPGTGNSAGRNIDINKDRRYLQRSFYLGILFVT